MNELGWDVYSFDHEGGDGQYEFDFGYTDALQMADRMLIFRLMAKHVARTLGCFASFMPKPFQTSFGSGAHLNVSLAEIATGRNVFEGGAAGAGATMSDVPHDQAYGPVSYQFTAGVLAHADALMAVLSPTVNSYKRLMPRGLMQEISWAPVFQAWGYNNRTLMCRLPMNRRCLEVRTADSAVNFYLGAALVLAAGLDGVRRELKPARPGQHRHLQGQRARPGRDGRAAAAVDAGRGDRRVRAERLRAEGARHRAACVLRRAQASGVAGVQHGRRRVGAGQVPAPVVTAHRGDRTEER